MNLFYLYVGVSGLLITILAFNVSRVRISERIRNGDGGNKRLKIASGAYSNALEHSVPFALMIFVLQAQGANNLTLSVMVVGFLVFRLLHAFGMLYSIFRVWQIAATLSYLWSFAAAIMILVNLFTN